LLEDQSTLGVEGVDRSAENREREIHVHVECERAGHHQELERDLRRRIIDYLFEGARNGQPLLMIDMAYLVENPLIRWGFGWEGQVEYRVDNVRQSDIDLVPRQFRGTQNVAWWELTSRFFSEAPDRAVVVRNTDDRICGFMVCMSVATAPAFAMPPARKAQNQP